MASLNTQKMLGMQLLESAEGDPWPQPLFRYPQRSGSEPYFISGNAKPGYRTTDCTDTCITHGHAMSARTLPGGLAEVPIR